MSQPALTDVSQFIRITHNPRFSINWKGDADQVVFDLVGFRQKLADLQNGLFVINQIGKIGIAAEGDITSDGSGMRVAAWSPAMLPSELGDPAFKETYGLTYAYMAGAMANAIASEAMVIELGKKGMLGSFGSAGVIPSRLEGHIQRIQAALPDGPYAFNLINSPNEPAMERGAVELFLRYGVRNVEASAFLKLTPSIIYYRLAGLSQDPDGEIRIKNRVIAKVSRREVAGPFMEPAPAAAVKEAQERQWQRQRQRQRQQERSRAGAFGENSGHPPTGPVR